MMYSKYRALSVRWFMQVRVEVAQAELDAALNARARSHLPFTRAVDDERRFSTWVDEQLGIERATA
jgi:hypothetical protein